MPQGDVLVVLSLKMNTELIPLLIWDGERQGCPLMNHRQNILTGLLI
jgi:hypothetical protein